MVYLVVYGGSRLPSVLEAFSENDLSSYLESEVNVLSTEGNGQTSFEEKKTQGCFVCLFCPSN